MTTAFQLMSLCAGRALLTVEEAAEALDLRPRDIPFGMPVFTLAEGGRCWVSLVDVVRHLTPQRMANMAARLRAQLAWAERALVRAAFRPVVKHRDAIRRATVPWSNRKAIAAFYIEARALTAVTGLQHDVDHIIPLRGKLVCGLHVAENLRVITHQDNHTKRNRFIPT